MTMFYVLFELYWLVSPCTEKYWGVENLVIAEEWSIPNIFLSVLGKTKKLKPELNIEG